MIMPQNANLSDLADKLEMNKLIKEKEKVDEEMKSAGLIGKIKLSHKSLKLSKRIAELELGKMN